MVGKDPSPFVDEGARLSNFASASELTSLLYFAKRHAGHAGSLRDLLGGQTPASTCQTQAFAELRQQPSGEREENPGSSGVPLKNVLSSLRPPEKQEEWRHKKNLLRESIDV